MHLSNPFRSSKDLKISATNIVCITEENWQDYDEGHSLFLWRYEVISKEWQGI